MNYTVEKTEDSKVKISVEISPEEWESAVQEAYLKNRGKFGFPGFRKGHVPRKTLEGAYGKEMFYEDALDVVLPKYYGEIMEKETDLDVMSAPEPSVKKIDDTGVAFEILVTVRPEVKLGQYKGLKIEKEVAAVTDEEVQAELELARDRASRLIEGGEGYEAKKGDTVNLDFCGKVDGVAFDGGTADKFDLELGSGSFVPGFEEQLTGVKVGDVRDVNITFPTDYHADLAGKDAVFTCTINKISYRELPEVDDEFVKDVSDFDTLDEYKADIKARLLDEAKKRVETTNENKLVDTIVDGCETVVPSALVAERQDEMLDEFAERLQYQGLKIDDYCKYLSTTPEQLKASYKEAAEKYVKARLVFEQIIHEEKLQPTSEAIEAKIAEIAANMKQDVESFRKGLTGAQLDYVANMVLNDQLIDYLKANND